MALVDEIAEELHNVWWTIRLEAGDTLGPRDPKKGRHPHLIPWSAKTEQERTQDRYQALRVMLLCRENPRATQKMVAERLHEALQEFRKATEGKVPDYLEGPWDRNERSRQERTRQATAIGRLFKERMQAR